MKQYHIVFRPTATALEAVGINVEAESPIQALWRFNEDHPDAVFLYIASSEMFSHKYLVSVYEQQVSIQAAPIA